MVTRKQLRMQRDRATMERLMNRYMEKFHGADWRNTVSLDEAWKLYREYCDEEAKSS
jgi:hypothetical protein